MTIDRDSWLWRRGRLALVALAVLLLAGGATQPLQNGAWGAVRARQPELNLRSLQGALGQGVVLGVLGGFRTLLADFVWLKRYYHWEKRELAQTEALIRLAVTLDPSAVHFWDNGASQIGMDIPHWRIQEEGGFDRLPEERRNQIFREQGERALAFLDEGLALHPGNIKLLVDKALVYTNRMNDLAGAAGAYRQIAEKPGVAYHFPRVYAETLYNLGRVRDAYDYYRKLYPTLPDGDLYAEKPHVFSRMRTLEDELKLPAAERLPDAAAPPGYAPPPPEPPEPPAPPPAGAAVN